MADDMPKDRAGDSGDESVVEDERIFEEMRDAVRRRAAVPPGVLTAARAALSWRTIDAELAAISYDSLSEDREPALVRGPDTSRLLSFDAPGVTLDLEVVDVGRMRRLVGQLVPAEPAVVEVRQRDHPVVVETDERGRFAVSDIAPGPTSLVCRFPGHPGLGAIATDWIVI